MRCSFAAFVGRSLVFAHPLEVLGAEIEHRLPLDWPNQHGTVAALAQQLGSHVMEVKKVTGGGTRRT